MKQNKYSTLTAIAVLGFTTLLTQASLAGSPPAPGKIAFRSSRDGDPEIYVMNSDGTNQTRLTNSALRDDIPRFSADGKRIAFTSERDGNAEIYVMNADGTGQTRLTLDGAVDAPTDDVPSFSPNGARIVFVSNREDVANNNFDIYVMDADGANITRLTNDAAYDRDPRFSPDGTRIIFTSNRDGNDEIYVMNANGTGQTRITNNTVPDYQPMFSPNGTLIVFTSFRDGNEEIYVMDANGGNQTRLTNNSFADIFAAFSPDGTQLTFASNRDGNYEIYFMNVNGTDQARLTIVAQTDIYPSWIGIGIPPCAKKYAFYPHAGNFFSDLYPTNFNDLDPSPGILDYNCADYTIDGKIGIDTIINGGFTAQAIGVPVFAVLDGVVVETHDGEDDMNTTPNPVPDNHVKIDHGDGHVTTYAALKKNSIVVAVSQVVKAGQQIALTGSSGASFRPHLDFRSEFDGVNFEPFAGPCRAGESNWISQPPFRPELYLREFVITSEDLTTWAGPPFDTTRAGTYLVGTRAVNFWFVVGNGQGIQNLSARYLRPDGSERLALGPYNIAGATRNAYYTFNVNVNLDVPGTWHIEVSSNGQVFTTAPFTVISSGSPVNRAPAAVQAVFDPLAPVAGDVLFCRINSDTVYLDPDYDFVRYHYLWQVNGVTVRDVIVAGLADAIPRNTAQTGDTITCTVTPSDGIENGPATVLSVAVAAPANLLNISTRADVRTGDDVLIGGLIITGVEGKKILLRAIGIGPIGVAEKLDDPTLTLHDGNGAQIDFNDNWNERPEPERTEIANSGFGPAPAEPAMLKTLPPGPYTAIVRGKNETTGLALVEVYDFSPNSNSKLANISTRGFVDTGDKIMIGGAIAGGGGGGGVKVIIRGLGPSLTNFGIPNPLLDPTLEIHDANGLLLNTNDNWKDCQQSEIEATGLAPSNDAESAIVMILPPGGTTAQLRGQNNTTGVGLVEIYKLQ